MEKFFFPCQVVMIGALLGEGAFGTVRRLRDGVVIKRFRPSAKYIIPYGFVREVAAFRLLGPHPSIVPFLALGQNSIELKEFAHHCEGQIKDPIKRQLAFCGLVQALVQIHNKGLAFRDLKGANTLSDGDRHFVICDLGTCNYTERGTGFGDQPILTRDVTTLEYAAPELLLGTKYGASVDLWALGIVLFEWRTGKLPFNLRHWQKSALFNCLVQAIGAPRRPQLVNTKEYRKFQASRHGTWTRPSASVLAKDPELCLIHKLLQMDPEERITLTDLVVDPYCQAILSPPPEVITDPLIQLRQAEWMPPKLAACPSRSICLDLLETIHQKAHWQSQGTFFQALRLFDRAWEDSEAPPCLVMVGAAVLASTMNERELIGTKRWVKILEARFSARVIRRATSALFLRLEGRIMGPDEWMFLRCFCRSGTNISPPLARAFLTVFRQQAKDPAVFLHQSPETLAAQAIDALYVAQSKSNLSARENALESLKCR